jgi:hypothetical protein
VYARRPPEGGWHQIRIKTITQDFKEAHPLSSGNLVSRFA